MQKILYAADFSERDRDPFHQACRFARAWHAKLLIAHVDDSERTDAKEKVDFVSSVSQKLFDIFPDDLETDYDHILRAGDPAKVILDIEKEHNVDLIVLGTHGRKGIDRVFAGSVAEQVIRLAECPVLTLRRTHSQTKASHQISKTKILVPTDFSIHGYAALDFAAAIANSVNGGITILYVDDSINIPINKFRLTDEERHERRNELWSQLKKTKPNNAYVEYGYKLLEGTAATQIVDFANELEYDYIVLGTHGRTGIGRALIGSVAEKVVRTAACPVISVKPSTKHSSVVHYLH